MRKKKQKTTDKRLAALLRSLNGGDLPEEIWRLNIGIYAACVYGQDSRRTRKKIAASVRRLDIGIFD